MLVARTEGNPFFVEESVRTLVEAGALDGNPGAYRLTRDVASIEVPATVQGVLAARIDRLPADDKQLLQAASVIGKDVPFGILQTIAELPEDALRRSLANLQDNEFLYEARLFPDLEYTFKHAHTHEVTYGSLLAERRRKLHERILDAIEELYPDRLTEVVERLALHAFRGEIWDRAVGFLKQSGAKAAARSAYREAAVNLEQALDALGHLPEAELTLRQGIDLRFDLRSALQALGEHDRVFEHLREAEALAVALGDRDRLGWASAFLSQYLWRMGEPEKADALGRRALSIAEELEDFELHVVTNFFLGQGHFNVGDYRRAVESCRRNVADIQGEQAYQRLGLTGLPSVLSRVWLAWSLAEQGAFPEAMVHAQDALSIAETANHPYSVTAAYLGIGQVHLVQGVLDEAIAALERAARLCDIWDLGVIQPTTAATLGLAYALSGRFDEALPLLEAGEAPASPVRIFDTPTARLALGTGYLLAGHATQATTAAKRALDFATERGFRGTLPRALRLLGEIAAGGDKPTITEAETYYDQARALAEEFGMRPVVAHCHLGLGRLYRRSGESEPSGKHLDTAAAMYRDMDMGFWLERTQAEMSQPA
jgi:tetratricopeptide (TPR) repeat protein